MIGTFIAVGVRHLLSLEALDHLLFLAALAASYRLRDWRHGLTVVSAFTVGHSITLALVALGLLAVPTALVEFLIPCTIVVAAAENLWARGSRPTGWQRPALAGLFGLVHGAGFATTLGQLFGGGVALPLLGFNVGIELGQVVILASIVSLLTAGDWAIRSITTADHEVATRWRLRATSVAVGAAAVMIAAGRLPW
ncbi:MAG: HupE/UreJ family protein [Gemmatimonadales bacterium]